MGEIGERLIKEINNLSMAIKTQDNHVLADLDTYGVERSLDCICGELKRLNENIEEIINGKR